MRQVFGRYVRLTKTGKLMLDKAKIRSEAQYDGKYLLSTSDIGHTAEDVVLGYKQLSEIERVFRDMKHLIANRQVRRRLPDRIKAHVLLCWLGMLLNRSADQEAGQTWIQIKKALSALQVGMLKPLEGDIFITWLIRKETCDILYALKVNKQSRYIYLLKLLSDN